MEEYTVKRWSDGEERWFLNGQLHRVDGPAVTHPDGYQAWWLNGKRHREDGPAIIFPDGEEHWYLNGELHRPDGPAIIYSNGTESWYLNDQKLTKEQWEQQTQQSYDGKVVEIESKRYQLKEI